MLEMKKILLPIFTTIFLFLSTTSVLAVDYYVAKNGNDNNPGTEAQPWKTIQHASDMGSGVGPGDTVFVRGGTYNTAITQNISGTSGNLITYKNYPDEIPIITGNGWARRWYIADQSYIRIEGIHFEDYEGQAIFIRTFDKDVVGIEIINNTIKKQRTAARVGDNAEAGDAIGGSTWTSGKYIRNVTVEGNYLENINTGERWVNDKLMPANEAVSFEGLIHNLKIVNNRIDQTIPKKHRIAIFQ